MTKGTQRSDLVRTRPDLPPDAARVVAALAPSLPDPEQSMRFLNRLLTEVPSAAAEIVADATALRYALTIFSYSRFLADTVIRYPGWLLEIAQAGNLHHGYLAEQYEDLLEKALPPDGTALSVDLALFRRRQLLRIVLRDVLRFADLSETAEDLSNLADAILNVTWRAVRRETLRNHPGAHAGEGRFSILAVGKLGGRELNYSSDIDLIFVSAGGDPDFFRAAANRMTSLLSAYTPEGVCYRVDLRLRPDGRYGEVVPSLEGAKQYYASRGRDWELQMLIKARVGAGDPEPGRQLLEFVEPLIYKTTTDFGAVEAVSETRARIHERQRKARPAGLDVKLARGGIRDIEFLVQCLQRLHGGATAWVRHGGTLLALSRLRDRDLLSPLEYSKLVNAYQFLRHLEHRLQFDEDRQTHTLPTSQEQLDLLARRMPSSTDTLQQEIDQHFSAVRDLYDRVIHSQLPSVTASLPEPEPESESESVIEEDEPARPEFPSSNLRRLLDLRAPALSQLLAAAGIQRSQASLESFLEKMVAEPGWLDILNRDSELARCTIDIFEHSRYFADQLVGQPELLEEVQLACGNKQGRHGFRPPHQPDLMRRYFREQMVRIQSDSIFHRVPVFRTLERTSELAQAVIAAAYDIAVADLGGFPDQPPPEHQMMVVALGRLGMMEFDLASDADLIFVIPDDADRSFWTSVAERLMSIIGAYTGDGVIFTIDARLRPNGRAGDLVTTETACRDYFENSAEAWEGISWMKARAVAGNLERARSLLSQMQEIDWRLYGQSGRSRTELARMRMRLEREQGSRNPLKAGLGGYYDIDFMLMYLRLRGAGFFFEVLNTPARIETVEKMGLLDREEARFLLDAATFFRAVDHGLRLVRGHAEGKLPKSRADIGILTELVHRWTPPHLHEGSLESVVQRIRHETRAHFEKLFGKATAAI